MEIDDLPPADFPPYGATRAEHLAWIHRSARSLMKEWRRLKADVAPLVINQQTWPDDLQQAVTKAMIDVRCLCESVAIHLPEVARRWPMIRAKGYAGLPDQTLGLWVGGGGWTGKVDQAIVELKVIVSSAATGKPLTGRQREALRVLYKHKAFSRATQINTKQIATLASDTTAGNYKSVIAALKRRDLVDTSKGAGGGVWLKAKGRAECQRLFG